MDFRQAEQEYHRLKAQYDAGQLSEERMRAALSDLMVQDEQGRWWVLGYETGAWYVHDGEKWVTGEPPATATAAPTRSAAPTAPGQAVQQPPAQPLRAQSQPWPWIAAALAVVGIVAVVLLTRPGPDGTGQVAVQGTPTDDVAALTAAAADVRAATVKASTVEAVIAEAAAAEVATRQAAGVQEATARAATAEAATRQAADEERRPLRIAYHSSRSGNHDIWIMNLDGSGQRRLVGSAYDEFPYAWSPRTGELLYTQGIRAAAGRTEREAFGLFLETGESEVVTSGLSNVAGADWSPDGRAVVVASNRRLTDNPEVVCDIPVTAAARHDILLLSGGRRVLLVESGTTPEGFRMCGTQSPRWSPAAGGNYIAFAAMNREAGRDRWNVYRVNTDGTGMCELAAGGDWHNESPAWSPDGRWVAYISTRNSSSPSRYGLFVVSGRCSPGTQPAAVVLSSELDVRMPAWSPDGRQIAFSARNSNGYYDLYLIDVDSRGNPTGKPQPLTTTPSISESGPVWVY
jgi:Tol biopolymer transport system component